MVVGDLATAVDVVVLGAGPGGYVAAIRAAQLGKEVALIDPHPPGGTCLHHGCIPAKALLTAAGHAAALADMPAMGIAVGESAIDLPRMQQWKNGVVARLAGGLQQLLAHHQIEVITGQGRFTGPQELQVEGEHGVNRFLFDQAVIAVGGSPAPLPGLPFDNQRVLTPAQALVLTHLPGHIAIFGADTVAAELATIFIKLGAAVTLALPADQPLLAQFAPSAVRLVQARLKKLGVTIKKDMPNLAALDAPIVVISAGITPNTGNLGLNAAGVQTDKVGFVRVTPQMQTTNPAIYAVGDVTGGPPLAGLAIKQGKVAALALANQPARFEPQAVPWVAWTDPQIAAVGFTPAQAQAAGYQGVSGRFPLGANGRALTLNAADGFALVVAEKESGVLLGVTIVGRQAEALIGEVALALEMGATLTDLAETIHPHPSVSESFMEAAEAALGIAVHIK
jgi:dihydrolipoamide dehydrogenase